MAYLHVLAQEAGPKAGSPCFQPDKEGSAQHIQRDTASSNDVGTSPSVRA
jgi:hypothetical protein